MSIQIGGIIKMKQDFKQFIFKAIALAMGIATFALNIMNSIESKSAITLISIGLICLAISSLESNKMN